MRWRCLTNASPTRHRHSAPDRRRVAGRGGACPSGCCGGCWDVCCRWCGGCPGRSTTPTSTVTLLRSVANPVLTPAVPVFTYCTTATDPATTCTAATNANSVAAVGIELVVAGKNGTTMQRVRSLVAITGAVS